MSTQVWIMSKSSSGEPVVVTTSGLTPMSGDQMRRALKVRSLVSVQARTTRSPVRSRAVILLMRSSAGRVTVALSSRRAYLLNQRFHLVRWPKMELLMKELSVGVVLAKRFSVIAFSGVGAHQCAMRTFA